MQGRGGRLLHLISRRLRPSTSRLSSLKRFSSSEEVLTEIPSNGSRERPTQHRDTPQSYKQNPSENFASGPNSEPHPNPNPLKPANISSDASLPEVNKCIWAVERLSKGKMYAICDRKQERVPGYLYDQDSPAGLHVLVLMDKFQIQSLWDLLGDARFMCTVFTLEVFDGLGSLNILYRERVLPRRVNFDSTGKISNVGYCRAPPGMKLRLDVPILIYGQEDCRGLKKGGSLKVHLSYASLFCLPEELPPYVEVHVNGMDIGDKICLGDLGIGVLLHPNNQPLLPILEIV